jgi:hypothetical protein
MLDFNAERDRRFLLLHNRLDSKSPTGSLS